MNGKPKIVRCAIYTRKSSEHNLDLEFNSLHAQREACEAYIKSQMHEGWQLIPENYDDGGISGASLARPDIQRLLADIAAGKVDNVVVYKVDRLTRSLTDFARLVELFDKHGVSFVSITQSFNTTSSMGRLTLNVLLSFAQFEREVIGERVRDKIAASKAKGLFMGGSSALGYINLNKHLVIVPEEAEKVRWIFRRYLELGSIGRLLEDMNTQGIVTRWQTLSNGKERGGRPFVAGALAYLLKNRCYVGEILHKGTIHAANHDAIIDRDTFEAVQASLAANAVARKATAKSSPFPLAGLLFDSAGNRMTPSHSRKKGVRYRYYVSQAVLQFRKGDAGAIFRVPAPDIEALVEAFVRERCRDYRGELRPLIEEVIARITIQAEALEVQLCKPGQDKTGHAEAEIVMLPWSKKPFQAAKGVVHASLPAAEMDPKAQEALLAAIGRARRWADELTAGQTVAGIAKEEGKGRRQIRLLLPLAFLPPREVSQIMRGQAKLRTITDFAENVPLIWC